MQLTKHHGLGNDFLVLLDLPGLFPVGAEVARAACDRHRGVGADGLIRVTAGVDGARVTMQLLNADGSDAEISGNGLACMAQAVVLAGVAASGASGAFDVTTDAGRRRVSVDAAAAPRTHEVTVDMGAAKVGDEEPEWLDWCDGQLIRAVRVEMGNPHLVLHAADPDAAIDIEALGGAINTAVPGGVNVEVVTVGPGPGELTMRVYERGVGITQACGSGACAVAAAAMTWELSGANTVVHQPGGTAKVVVGDDGGLRLTVPAVHVATVDFPWP